MKKLVVALLGLSMAGCASWALKKQCNNTNWFNHGEGIALQGKRLDQDDFIQQCKKVEAEVRESDLDLGFKKGMKNYCEPETVYQTGRKGQFFNKDMCDSGGLKNLLAKHSAGVSDYCEPNNGYSVGTSGVTYNFICPKKLEKAFLLEFNRGRKVYLNEMISQRTSEISNIETEIERKERERRELRREAGDLRDNLARLKSGSTTTFYLGRKGGIVNEKTSPQEVDTYQRELDDDIRDKDWKISSVENEIKALEQSKKSKANDISNFRKEIIGL